MCVQGMGGASLDLPMLQLAWWDGDRDAFVPVPTNVAMNPQLPGGLSSSLYTVPHKFPALKWRLSWARQEGKAASALQLCRRIFVNPQNLGEIADLPTVDLPPAVAPLSAAMEVVLRMKCLMTSLLPAGQPMPVGCHAIPGSHVLDTLVVLALKDVGISYRAWKGAAMAVEAKLAASLDYLDTTTLCMAPLVDECVLSCSYCVGNPTQAPGPGGDAANAGQRLEQDIDWHVNGSSAHPLLGLLSPQPSSGTLASNLHFDTDVNVHLTELALYSYHRLIVMASKAEFYPFPFQLTNFTDMDLSVRQFGTAEEIPLPQGSAVGYHWCVPPACRPNARLALQLGAAAPASKGAVSWSQPLEASP